MSADGHTLPLPASADLSTVTILADGEPIALTIHLVSIVIIHEVNRIPTAKLVFADGDVSKQTAEVSNLPTFAPGVEIEIQPGYHNQEEPVFKGVVVRHGLKSRSEGPSLLTVVCKDKAAKMTVARASRYFYDVTDSDVMEELITAHGLSADVTATNQTHESIVQYQGTDWDFLLMRAELAGMLAFVADGTVTVKAPDPGQSPVQTFVNGATILNFEAELDAESQLKATSTAAWDPSTHTMLETEGADPGYPDQGNITAGEMTDVLSPDAYHLHHSGHLDETELQTWSDSLLSRSRLAKIRGRMSCQGFAGVRIGDVIELQDVGERFDGTAYVSAVRHDINQGNWLTHLQLGLDRKWFHQRVETQAPSAAGMLPAIDGLHIGIVTALDGDPKGEDRIRVRLPAIHADEDGVWTRICTLDAGADRGTVFRPEVEDEVIVGFLYGDPRQAVMLGMVHSSKNPSPIPPDADNHEKIYKSRAGTELYFHDDTPLMHIRMASGRLIELDDAGGTITITDDGTNTVLLDDAGITLESSKDITLKAGGDVKIDGTNIDMAASAELKADGGAGSKLTSGATTVVKGATVMIN